MVPADQGSSLLLSKLPAELRFLIWEYAIGRQHLHILRKKDKFRHVPCHPKVWKLDRPATAVLHGHANAYVRPGSKCTSPYTLSADDQLAAWSMNSLLCACQQIHSEAVEIMYSNNTFLFSSPFIITNFFSNYTLLSYRNLIRTVIISIGAPEPTPRRNGGYTFVTERMITQNLVAGAWDSIHETLETLPNLRTVQIFIPEQRPTSSLDDWMSHRDYGILNNRIFQFFTLRKTKFALKSLEIYTPFLQVTVSDDNLTWDHDPSEDHYATELQGQLNAEGVACTVVAGGILTLGEQRPASVE